MKATDVCPLPGSEVGILGHRYTGHPGPWAVNEVEMKSLFPRIDMSNPLEIELPHEDEYGTMDPFGRDLLLRVARDLQPRRILEVGTFHGLTTRRLAVAAPEALILTIDLPPNTTPALASDLAFVDHDHVGAFFANHEVSDRITQVRADSASVEARDAALAWLDASSPLDEPLGCFDLILIDGAHDYESTHDTFMNLVLPTMASTAVVFFDDYARMASHTGVTHCVLELAHAHRKNFYWYAPTGNTSHVALYLHNESDSV